MRRFAIALSLAALCACYGGLAGCGEDNEAELNAQAAKSTGTVDQSKIIPQSKTQADYFKNNPGTSGAATSTKAAAKTK